MPSIVFNTKLFIFVSEFKNYKYMKKIIYILSIALGLGLSANAQVKTNSGPRFGITVVTPGLLGDILNGDRNLGDETEVNYSQKEAIMSQFGWQWETVLKEGKEFNGIVEWIGFIGGLERGTIVPSFSSLIGIRKNSGFEIAMGPTASLTGIGLVVATGYTFRFGDLNVPVNIALVPSRTKHFLGKPLSGENEDSGHGVTVTVGFNFSK